jgi:hypothetical protein
MTSNVIASPYHVIRRRYMSSTVLLDDEVIRMLDTAAMVAGLQGPGRYNAVVRRLLKLPDFGSRSDGPSEVSGGEKGGDGLERICSIDEIVLDQTLRGSKPTFLYGPDGESEKLVHWSDVLTGVANWLVQNGHVTEDLPPITGYRRHPLISKDRAKLAHPDVGREVHDGWWIETWGNVNTKGRNLRRLLLAADVDPTQFRVGGLPREEIRG